MRVARAHHTNDDRRRIVVDMLTFIHDFRDLDTTSLIQKAHEDFKFVEAAEAVLQTAVGAWKSVEALCDFCVHHMFGDKPPDPATVDHIKPRGRVSPFSVPFELIRAMAPNPGQFDPHRLRSLSHEGSTQFNGFIGEDRRWDARTPQTEAWLVTGMRAFALPDRPTNTTFRVTDQGSNRILHEGKVWPLFVEPTPCFWWLPPVSFLEFAFTRQREDPETELLLIIEGWRYLMG